jgi:hypothetical protein
MIGISMKETRSMLAESYTENKKPKDNDVEDNKKIGNSNIVKVFTKNIHVPFK